MDASKLARLAQVEREFRAALRDAGEVSGADVRAWRTEHGLTQSDVAERLGVKQAHLSRMETGHRPLSRSALLRFARLVAGVEDRATRVVATS